VVFGSRPWLAAAVAALQAQPGLAAALQGLGPDAALVIEASPGLPRAIAVWGRHDATGIAEWRLLEDEDELLELEPAYVLRAPYRTWKALLRGEDAVQAALSGRVRVRGDLERLVRRAAYRHVVEAALRQVTTEFADEGASRCP
jgi:hypothetical protein